jgi:dUTP pyrophosphatase
MWYVELIHPLAKYPSRAHDTDAGADVFTVVDVCLAVGERKRIPLGLRMAFPAGQVIVLEDKSGYADRLGLTLLGRIIDSTYRDPVECVGINLGDCEIFIPAGAKICQMIRYFIDLGDPIPVGPSYETKSLPRTDRGGGFGSTSSGA